MSNRRKSTVTSAKPTWVPRLVAATLGVSTILAVVYWASSHPKRMTDAAVAKVLNAAEKSLATGNLNVARQILKPLERAFEIDARTLLRATQVAIECDAGELADDLLTRLDLVGLRQESQFLRGVLALRRHRARDAERWWRDTIADGPAMVAAWERLCQLYMTQMRSDDLRWAMEGLRQTRALTLDELVVYTTAYEPYYSAEERLETVRQYATADPEDSWSWAALAKYQLLQGHATAALKTLDDIQTGDADGIALASRVEVVLQRDAELAAALLPSAAVGVQEPLPICRARGLVAFRQRDWRTAVVNLQKVAQTHPLDTIALYQLGQALERIDQRNAAEILLRRVQQQEQVNNLVFRIRKTSHLPVARLAPLVFDVCGLLADLDRGTEGVLWLRAIADPAVDPTQWKAAMARLSTAGLKPQLTLPSLVPSLRKQVGTTKNHDSMQTSKLSLAQPKPVHADRDSTANRTPPIFPPIQFEERQNDSGLHFQYESGAIGQKWLLETLGGGIAVLDYDNDGMPDVYFAQGGPLQPGQTTPEARPSDRLFRNLGAGQFEDVTERARLGDINYSHGCTAGDFDNDGDADLLVANFGKCAFYRNEGDGTFVDITQAASLSGRRWHTSAAFDDLDRDGNLDLYVVTYVEEPFKICRRPDGSLSACSPANYPAEPDVLYRNRGDGTFEDISDSAGILVTGGKGLGITVADLNADGRPDVYVTNDGTPNFLFRNNGVDPTGKLRFEEIAMRAGCAVNAEGQAQAGMGSGCADFDGDGLLDLVTTNFFNEGATFYRNQGADLFEDVSATSGLLEPTRRLLGFGIQPVDFDNSGRLGLMIANGHIDDFGDRHEPWKMRPIAFVADGEGRFREATWQPKNYFSQEVLGRVVARLDYDCDLRTDLIVTHLDRPAALLKNTTKSIGQAISFDLVGVQSNRDGRGSRITVTAAGVSHVYELTGGDGYLACNERRIIIGVGKAEAVDVCIQWPNGGESKQRTLPTGSHWTVIEDSGFFKQHMQHSSVGDKEAISDKLP